MGKANQISSSSTPLWFLSYRLTVVFPPVIFSIQFRL